MSISDERLTVFLSHALKPEEISGVDAEARVEELLGWFKRYFEGNANPKWFRAHSAELAYTREAFDDQSEKTKDHWRKFARAALNTGEPKQ